MEKGLQLFMAHDIRENSDSVSSILSCNDILESHGLQISAQQALELAKGCQASIRESRRIEFQEGITAELLRVFCDSPYLSQRELADTIMDLTDLFYTLKNDTCDQIPDTELISFMKEAFDGECHGSMELLVKKGMELSERIHEEMEVSL